MIDPVTGSLILGGANLLGGLIGGSQQNSANAREAQKNREWQERMSNTAWQRGVDDITKAGLNVGLAYGKGGASTPGGAQAHMENVAGPAVNSAVAALEQGARIASIKAQIDKTEAETDYQRQETMIRQQLANRGMELTAEQLAELRRYNQPNYIATEIGQREADLKLTQTNAKQAQLELPALENMSRAAQTWWGRNVTPFLSDAKTAAGLAAGIAAPALVLRKGRMPSLEKIDEDIFFGEGQVFKRKTISRNPRQ